MTSIYTTQLVNRSTGANFNGTIYTVPAGSLAIITNIDYRTTETAAGNASEVSIGSAYVYSTVSTASGNSQHQWAGRQVATAGQTIGFTNAASASWIMVTGYLLNLP